jgi:hypothetical protein
MTFLYLAVTVIDLFDQEHTETRFETLTAADGAIALLATARQEFSLHPSVAWETISQARRGLKLAEQSYPLIIV